MKPIKAILLGGIIIMTFNLKSQRDSVGIKHKIKCVETTYYNLPDLNIKNKVKRKFAPSNTCVYEYSDKGLLTSCTRFTSSGAIQETEKYVYNNKDKLSLTTFYGKDSILLGKQTYVYDYRGNL